MANGLYQAVRTGRYRQMRYLIENGLSVNSENHDGYNGLVAAMQVESRIKRPMMMDYLIRKGINTHHIDRSTGRDPLIWAAYLDRPREVDTLLRENKGENNCYRKDKSGNTALHYAVIRNNTEIVRLLGRHMEKYALSVDVPSGEGFTPYLLAKRLGHAGIAGILLQEFRASPEQFDDRRMAGAEEWVREGRKERRAALRDRERQEVALLKALGRLPELKRANFDPKRIKIVKSKADDLFLQDNLAQKYGKIPPIDAEADKKNFPYTVDLSAWGKPVKKTSNSEQDGADQGVRVEMEITGNYDPILETFVLHPSLFNPRPNHLGASVPSYPAGKAFSHQPPAGKSVPGTTHLGQSLSVAPHPGRSLPGRLHPADPSHPPGSLPQASLPQASLPQASLPPPVLTERVPAVPSSPLHLQRQLHGCLAVLQEQCAPAYRPRARKRVTLKAKSNQLVSMLMLKKRFQAKKTESERSYGEHGEGEEAGERRKKKKTEREKNKEEEKGKKHGDHEKGKEEKTGKAGQKKEHSKK